MGSDELGYDPSATPKLSLFSLPSKLHESPAGMLTPPIHTLASVPFKWEEAPGKPRPSCVTQSKPKIARCLELPPRLLNETKVSNMPSPTNVLDGPYASRSLSLGRGGSFSSNSKERVLFGSGRWGSFKRNSKEVVDASVDGGVSHGGETGVKITRIRRRSSFLGFPHTRSHLLVRIYKRDNQDLSLLPAKEGP
ncbi:unnamed protein product [Dovyalis caffra]|uniref:Uncharacterized protein n=1 Tax=Dovyalis caffra TaxID=77055 RepID=A0AAV1QR65_9ROSI|nr:unnamed protein product [Dovyalis caffra]